MIGQVNLLKRINTYTVDTFPRSSLIVGEKGMGKHTLVKYINDNIVKFPVVDITENISDELIDNIYRNPNPSIYLIDLSLKTEKEQNIILKFIEEPLNNSFIVLLAENKNLLLDTVVNRCIVFEMENYSKQELSTFLSSEENKDLILEIVKTPGKIINSNTENIPDILNVCEKIATKLSLANYANTLSIANKINYKDLYDKFDFDIFMNALTFTLFSQYLKSSDTNILNLYNITRDERKKLVDKRLNKEIFTLNLLTKLWKASRGID